MSTQSKARSRKTVEKRKVATELEDDSPDVRKAKFAEISSKRRNQSTHVLN